MKRFEFRLERVREFRSGQVSLEESKLHALLSEVQALEAARAELDRQRLSEARALVSLGRVEAAELTALETYRMAAVRRAHDLDRRAAVCRQHAENQRVRVLEARRKMKLLDRLKEKALAKWCIQENAEIENLAAEAYLAKYVRER
ncbi:MAG TPA: hypothetical protein VFQ79_03260 [Bryobacteraceae bacterium]|nr:hypothetical protein [Bryobacteraceae bacterium]